jgi:hypothetical protein
MIKNVQKMPFLQVIAFLYRRIFKQINIQHFLFTMAFITFGIGDAITAAMLMGTKGIGAESNYFARYFYATQGPEGFIAAKLWLTFFLLMVVFIIYMHSQGKKYWMVNGFLAALFIAGIMAIQANLKATAGLPFMSPTTIIFLFICMTFIFVEIGDIVDAHKAKKANDKSSTQPCCMAGKKR